MAIQNSNSWEDFSHPLILAGSGSSTQHPIGSGIVSRAFGQSARAPLGIYNFAGDLGKAVLPGGTSLLLIVPPWHVALWAIATLGLAAAVFITLLLSSATRRPSRILAKHGNASSGGQGFALLFAIGVLDTGVRMGVLIFLPFILKAKGASLPMIGVAPKLPKINNQSYVVSADFLSRDRTS
jgi:FSR family fosmidomycin resistance protein-like MFS transporter